VPSVHKYPPIAYRPPVDVRAPLMACAEQTGRPVSSIITEALREYLRESPSDESVTDSSA
jgi:hypothetical protein